MNFDYPETFPIMFFIDESGGVSYFSLAFERAERPVRTVAMNSMGLFGSIQELRPMLGGQDERGEDELFLSEFAAAAVRSHASVREAVGPLDHKKLAQHRGARLHSLLADTSGVAVVVEPGDEENRLTWIEGDHIMMTNFCNANFAGLPPEEAEGVAADRYALAHGILSDRPSSFGVDEGLKVLRATSWERTRASIVFDPRERAVYLVLERDFDRIYRASMDDALVETHSGFEETDEWPVRAWGLPAAVLRGESKPSFLERLWRFLGRSQ